MSGKLQIRTVLVLNANWQPINTRSPEEAISMLASDAATALDIGDGGAFMTPVRWKDWIDLPLRAGDDFVATVNRQIRIPRVIISVKYRQVPKKRPKFSPRAIYERDGGRCQYTDTPLKPGEGNLDHVVPRSRGGKTDFENIVLARKDINSAKADKTPEEAGLKLSKKPQKPKERMVTDTIKNEHKVKEWDIFLKKPL